MFDRQFLGSKVGAAALVSIAAMVTFNICGLVYQLDTRLTPHEFAATPHQVELA